MSSIKTNVHINNKERDYYFDNLKFFLIFLVVLGHLVEPLAPNSHSMRGVFFFIYLFHMPLFIFISGYFAKSCYKNGKFQYCKPMSLLILCFLLTISIDVTEWFFFKKELSINLFDLGGIAWFLFALAFYYYLIPFIRNMKPQLIIGMSIIFSILIGFDSTIGNLFSAARIINYLPFFLIGYYMDNEKIQKIIFQNHKKIFICGLLVICLFCLILFLEPMIYSLRPLLTGRNSYSKIFNGDYPFIAMVCRIIWFVVVPIVSILIMNIIPKSKNMFSKFGGRTLQIYFLHKIALIFYVNLEIYDVIKKTGIIYPFIIFLIAVLLTILLGQKIFSYPFDKILKMKFKFLWQK